MKRILVITALCVMVLGLEARAEVRVITDRDGGYLETRVLTNQSRVSHRQFVSERITSVWRPIRSGAGDRTLNPTGDDRRDLWPTIVEPEVFPHYPWVFWSRQNDRDFDLVWSRWSPEGWTSIDWIYPGIPGDDLDPDVAFDIDARPYVVWWVEENGRGRVFFSMYLETRWMTPLRISDGLVDSRSPQIALTNQSMVITFWTPNGDEIRAVQFDRPATITDDINPLDFAGQGVEVTLSQDGG